MSNLENINKEPTFREYMSYEEDQRKIRNTIKEEGYKEGIEEGLKDGFKQGLKDGFKQGIEQGIEQTAKNLLSMNMNIEDISKATGLSKEEIMNIK